MSKSDPPEWQSVEDPHLRQTRERLVRSLSQAALRANLILLALVAGLFTTLWWLAHEAGAAPELTTGIVLLLLVAAPGLTWIVGDWLTTRLWRSRMHTELLRLRATGFLGADVEAVGRERLHRSLDEAEYHRLIEVADQERNGYLVPLSQYTLALRALLQVAPKDDGTGAARSKRHRFGLRLGRRR